MNLINLRIVLGCFVVAGIVNLIGTPVTFAYGEIPVTKGRSSGYEEIVVTNGGTISGKVTFKGTPPPPKLHSLAKFPQSEFCGRVDNDGKGHRIQQVVKVGEGGALSDVVVFIEEIEKGKAFKFDGTDVQADTCRFLVQGPSSFVGVVKEGAEFRVKNMDADPGDPKSADGVLHNPHTYTVYGASSRTIFNKPLPTKGQVIDYKFKRLDLKKSPVIFLQCDQHNFMEAWFHQVKNPYYAVVGKDGTFTIDGIPPGEYELYAWHPMMQESEEKKITISPNQKISVDFQFTASDVKS
jgi:hypothetical protein